MKFEDKQTYNKRVMWLIFIIISITGVVLYSYQYTKLNEELDSKISYSSNLIYKEFNSHLLDAQKEYSMKVDKLLKIEGVTEAFALKDRKKLYELVSERYKEYKDFDSYLKIMTFRLTDGSAFLRVHKPQMYGDSLNKQRTIIIDVNTKQKRLFGFEIGKLRMSYRIVTPIFHNNKHIGLVEIGILPEKFTTIISDLFDTHNALMVRTEDTNVSLKQKEYMQKDTFSLVSDDPMFKEVFKLSLSKYKDEKYFEFIKNDDQSSYIVENNLNLLNQNNQIVAKILLAHNITDFREKYNKSLEDTLIFIIIVSVVLLLLTNISFNKYIDEITKSEELLSTIFDTTTESIAILDLNSNFLLVNHAYEKMTGFTKDELYDISCKVLTAPDDIEATKKVLDIVKEKGIYLGFEKSCFVKNGRRIDIRMNTVLMPDRERMLMTAHDITLEKKQMIEKKLQDQQMFQQSRLAQMGEMISMIAHQWRQPLGAISSTALNLKMKLELEAFDLESKEGAIEASNYFLQRLDNINGFVHNLTTTIDDFRNFYKPNKKSFHVNLDTVVIKSLKIIEASLLSDDIEIIKEYNSDEELEIYDSELMQVILNILKNAQDNFREKEIVKPKIIIKTEGKTISICDNGGGIPEDIMEKIFDPYFSTKDEKNGTGLGLYMSKTIVEEHHKGKLTVRNIEGGICFVMEVGDIHEK